MEILGKMITALPCRNHWSKPLGGVLLQPRTPVERSDAVIAAPNFPRKLKEERNPRFRPALPTIIARCAPKVLLIHFAVPAVARSSALAAELPWSWWTSWGLAEIRGSRFETAPGYRCKPAPAHWPEMWAVSRSLERLPRDSPIGLIGLLTRPQSGGTRAEVGLRRWRAGCRRGRWP